MTNTLRDIEDLTCFIKRQRHLINDMRDERKQVEKDYKPELSGYIRQSKAAIRLCELEIINLSKFLTDEERTMLGIGFASVQAKYAPRAVPVDYEVVEYLR